MLFALMVFPVLVFAQPCECQQTVTAYDYSCQQMTNCTSTDGCGSTSFTASCTGLYTISVSVSCSAGYCYDYNVCANVYDSSGQLVPGGNCHMQDCRDCQRTCSNTVCLTQNQQYKLYVCLIPCSGGGPLIGQCTATATVSHCGPVSCP